ncbi:MAG TPA: PepSY domain-containing protein [Pseudonocardia sp.]|nr:PepSY domain-containing protein [Pseudonocardia sp.]
MTDTTAFTPPAEPATQTEPPLLDPRGGAGRWWRNELRPLLMRVHFYAGLLVAPFVLVAAVTGLLYTATPQLEELVHHDQLHVSTPPGAAPLGMDQQVRSAIAAVPGGAISEIRPPVAPDGTTRVIFEVTGLPDGYFRTAFVDPYTAEVRGVLTTYGQWLPVRSWFDELHRTLHLGSVGEVYSELAASWLWVLTLSGLAMWMARQRRTRRHLALPRLSGAGRARLLSWHGSIGVWIALVLLFLSATGLTWSQFAGGHVTQLRHALSWSTPSVETALPGLAGGTSGVSPVPGAPASVALDAQRVLTVARAHGLSDPIALDPPSEPGHAWTVQQVKRSWPEKQDSLAIDATSGTVLDSIRFADWPIAAKLARWGVDAHMALLFGLPNQIALALVATGLIVMIGCGYRMWWRARPRPASAAQPGFTTMVLAGAVAVGIGLALPVFGASLLAFLLMDAIRTRRQVSA